jgi:hypothetical protein
MKTRKRGKETSTRGSRGWLASIRKQALCGDLSFKLAGRRIFTSWCFTSNGLIRSGYLEVGMLSWAVGMSVTRKQEHELRGSARGEE